MRGPVALTSAVAVLVAASIVVTVRLGEDARRFFGPFPAVLVLAGALLAGAGALRVLGQRGWPASGADAADGQVMLIAAVVAALAVSAIIADITIGFDEDMNVRWPGSVAFYLVMAVVAEVVFHLLPLALVAWLLGRPPDAGVGGRIAVALGVIAVFEAAFQVALSRADGDAALLTGFVGLQLVLFGIVQMIVYWQLGPWAMVLVRFAYYALWHVGWGYVRLRIIF